MALCCLAAITFGAGCSETNYMETAAEAQSSRPRAPSLGPLPWITAIEPHQRSYDGSALVATPSGDVFVAWISYVSDADGN